MCTNLTFSVAFVYLQHEREDNFVWALGVLRSVMDESALLNVIITDMELVLMNVISTVFPNATHLLRRWHISKNVLTNCKKLFMMKEMWERFMMIWNILVVSHI